VKLGLPVPPGFTISTEACRTYLNGDRFGWVWACGIGR
jgi:phosphoenolpyruvate synthase/pyruvate phosphate dikinase